MRASDDVRRRAIQIAAGGRNSIRQSLVKTGEAHKPTQHRSSAKQQRVSASLLQTKTNPDIQFGEATSRKRGEKYNPNESGTQHEHGDVRENTHGGGRLPVTQLLHLFLLLVSRRRRCVGQT